MEATELKAIWDEDPERCYSLHRVDGKTIRIRREVFSGHLIAEIFSPVLLKWEFIAFTTERILEHTVERVDQATAALLDEVRLILGDDV